MDWIFLSCFEHTIYWHTIYVSVILNCTSAWKLGQHKFGKQSPLLAIIELEWDGRSVTNQHVHTKLDWEG